MNLANPLVAAIERERKHPQKVRSAQADFRGSVALHEAAHVAVGYAYVPWGLIALPFKNPVYGQARNSCLSPQQDAESCFAGCAMDKVLFDHGIFAMHDYAEGMKILVREYGHAIAEAKASLLMDKALLYLLENLEKIQALATAAIPKAALAHSKFTRAAKKAGLEHSRVSPQVKADVDAYLRRFARTPEQLRADLGRENITRADDATLEHWADNATDLTAPPCLCGCGGPLFDGDKALNRLLEECRSESDLYGWWLRKRFGTTAGPPAGHSAAST